MAVNNFKDVTKMNNGMLFTEDSEFDMRELFPSPVFFARTDKIDNGILSEEIYRIRDEEIGKGMGNQIRSNYNDITRPEDFPFVFPQGE